MSDAPPEHNPPTQAPVEPLYTHPASPFMRTESNIPPQVAGIPGPPPQQQVQSTWITYRSQIEIGLALLAYMMFLVGSVTVLRANPDASWRYVVAVVPVLPAALVVYLFVRRLARTDELQKRIHTEAFGFALGATALLTFTYGFLEGGYAAPQLDLHPAFDGAFLGSRHGRLHLPVSVKNRLRVLRAELDWSQAELAQRLGVSRQTVNAIETGKYDPSLPLAFSLARTFKRRIEEIFEAEPRQKVGG